jgi:hypothetical protein
MTETLTHREILQKSFLKESTYFKISSPLFSAVSKACADDADILQLCAATRPGQSAVLLPHVVHYLVLKSPQSAGRLSRYFRSVTEAPEPAEAAFPAFKEFCLQHRSEVSELLSWRTVNTNLVEKASCLLPAVRYVEKLSCEPLTLLEICCSAGLNMLFDEYHYDYGPAGRVGSIDSPVQLICKLVGSEQPPVDRIPHIAHRVGVDLVTIDSSDPLERLWMEAVLCPEWTHERARLQTALALRVQRNLRTIKGDALEVLPTLLEELPGSLCVLQSYCMGHWSEPAKAALEEVLKRGSRHRDIHRIGIEMPESEPPETARDRLTKLAKARIPLLQKSFASRIEHTAYRSGRSTQQLLAQGDGFGVWLDWQVAA